MKTRTLALFAAFVSVALGARAALVLSNSFAYPDGALVTVSAGVWFTHSGTSGQMQVLGGKVLCAQTNSAFPAPMTSGTNYAGFTVNMLGLPAGNGGAYFWHYRDTGTYFRAKVWAMTNGAAPETYRVGVSVAGNSPVNIPTDLTRGRDYRLVVRYDLDHTNATLWVNPSSESTLTDTATASEVGGGLNVVPLYAVCLREAAATLGAGVLTFDDLLVGTAWRDAVHSTNANLASLTLSAGTLTPAFDSAVTNYTASVPNHTNSVTVTPTSADANATLQVRVNGGTFNSVVSGTASPPLPLNVGGNLIDVRVTAQDLTTIKTYTVAVTRENEGNHPPVANAGGVVNMFTGDTVILRGSATDPDGDLIYGWFWQPSVVPPGANWALTAENNPNPYFTANTSGDYVVSLIVLDSRGAISAPDYATIHVHDNLPPVAVATADRTNITVGGTVCFDGSQSSDPEARPLSFIWNFPDGSPPIFGTNRVCHTFTSGGTYDVGLQVTDERGAYDFDVVTITVLPPPVLRVALTSTNTVLLAWPAALTGYGLEQNANLATTNWLAVTNAPETMGDEKQVILPPAPGQNFYRLHKP